jgi:hypothetical protein
MSATVVRHPRSWTALAKRLKADIVAGREDAADLLPNLKLGVSTNFNSECAQWRARARMCGCACVCRMALRLAGCSCCCCCCCRCVHAHT